jgi:DJ-1 family protein
MTRVLVPLAAGFEEIETATLVDVLRRADVEVVVAGLAGPGPCRGSRGLVVVPDRALRVEEEPFDAVVLPGGMKGAQALAGDARLAKLLRDRHAGGALVAAICAAPLALDAAGLLRPGAFTCYPGIEASLSVTGRRSDAVIDQGGVATSQGPGTAMAFALHLVERLCGVAVRDELASDLLFEP